MINIRPARNKNYGTNGTLTAGVCAGVYGRYNGGLSLNNRGKRTNLYGSYNLQHRVHESADSSSKVFTNGCSRFFSRR